MLQTILSNPLYCLPLTIGIYLSSKKIYAKWHIGLLHPLAVTIASIIGLLLVSGVDYQSYQKGSQMISFLLGPSVVALGYVLYEQSSHLKGRVLSILSSVFMGAVAGLISVVSLAYLFGANDVIAASMQPRSVTTPIAIALSEQSGGIPALTAVVVVVAGIVGGLVGPPLFRLSGIESSIAKGLALGASAHGVGTSVAIQLGAIEGALSGLAIGIMGVFTSILIPLVNLVIDLFR
ncbi:membrane protein [Porphyromonas crevioricanis]|uniref:Membrane protein n=2 Tax=Porphyromonas crevioricanis TaxID=393921 RepID=A0A0A2FLQ4_9PORP|nr:LrgB family protein [Porphyromonas crevioricanis]KGN90960.1 membrane protein [Porphyromonas crevioricanis]KGN95056.1 membrane protein [Porphyromonas crevioricanis]SJZ54438.1 TIGR00659 family protein [Porphyromonas crevioricanis]SQH73286.1 Inner membrane protein yohK [Porphyromonas crevioricanis]GAD06273.1 LrgA-associated membrane protein LrgB [Porphyromonas crevioricanis JCM 15906]